MTLVYAFLFVALTVPGFVRAVRTLAWVDEKVVAGVKPWACNVCMTFWSIVLVWGPLALLAWGPEAVVVLPPAYTVAFVLLERVLEKPPENYPMIGPE